MSITERARPIVEKSIEALENDKSTMIEYLDLRRKMCDWHGVMDAAADIRELQAQINILTGVTK